MLTWGCELCDHDYVDEAAALRCLYDVVTISEALARFKVSKPTLLLHMARGLVLARQSGSVWLISVHSLRKRYQEK